MSNPATEVTTCSNKACKRKFPRVYLKCPYCKSKNLDKPKSNPESTSQPDKKLPEPDQKGTCLDPLHAGDNPNCHDHPGGQS